MWTPAVATIWESWRLTRRRLLLVPALATLCGWLLSRQGASLLAFIILLVAAIAMALSLPSFGTRPAFPLSKSFARPIRTAVLVGAPLAYVFAAAAASYFLPAAFLRVATGAPLPLLPAATLSGALAVLVAGSSWVTRDATERTGLAIAAYILAGVMVKFLGPFRYVATVTRAFSVKVASPQLCVLSALDYLAIVFLIGVIYLGIAFAVARQRRGDDELSSADPSLGRSGSDRGDIMESIRSTCVGVLRWRCPDSSPMAAQIWFEMQLYGLPVLVIGALLALCIPALIQWADNSHSAIPLVIAACTFSAPFLAGVGASIWNRRNASRDKVPAFEAARPVGTAELIGLQVLVTTVCIFAAWMLMAVSLWLSLPLLAELHQYGSPGARAAQLIHRYGVRLLSGVTVGFTLLATLIALLAAIRAFAGSNGMRTLVGAVALVLYIVVLMAAVAQGWVDAAVIDVHLWALVVAIPAGTLIMLAKALAGGILTRRQMATAMLAWSLFAVLSFDLLRTAGMMNAAGALAALALAATLLPLMAVGITPWSLSLIRHA
jgi:hypothetical protein